MSEYKAVAVLCGGLRKERDVFLPATYNQSDEFGMLGGHMRVAAAVGIQLMDQCSEFFFSGGASDKLKETFGPDVPAEAGVYREAFVDTLARLANDTQYRFLPGARKEPHTVLGEKAYNTASNIQEVIATAPNQGWSEVALLTNSYHVGRAKAWSTELRRRNKDTPGLPKIKVLAAEDVVQEIFPGVYDTEIKEAYQSEAGLLRQKHEAQGMHDMRLGQYVPGEFQQFRRGMSIQ